MFTVVKLSAVKGLSIGTVGEAHEKSTHISGLGSQGRLPGRGVVEMEA